MQVCPVHFLFGNHNILHEMQRNLLDCIGWMSISLQKSKNRSRNTCVFSSIAPQKMQMCEQNLESCGLDTLALNTQYTITLQSHSLLFLFSHAFIEIQYFMCKSLNLSQCDFNFLVPRFFFDVLIQFTMLYLHFLFLLMVSFSFSFQLKFDLDLDLIIIVGIVLRCMRSIVFAVSDKTIFIQIHCFDHGVDQK